MASGAAELEKRPCRIDIDAHAEVKVRFCHPADDRREMKYRACVTVDDGLQQSRLRNVSGDSRNAAIRKRRRLCDIDESELLDLLIAPFAILQRAALEQCARKPRSQKSRSSGDDCLHVRSILLLLAGSG